MCIIKINKALLRIFKKIGLIKEKEKDDFNIEYYK